MVKHKKDEYKCPLEATMDIIGGKYKGVIIGHLINKTLRPVVPPKTEYSLTKRGETLIPAIIELNKWGMNYLKEENIPCAYKGDIPNF